MYLSNCCTFRSRVVIIWIFTQSKMEQPTIGVPKNVQTNLTAESWQEHYSSITADACHTMPKMSIFSAPCVFQYFLVSFVRQFIVKWDVRMFCDVIQQLREYRYTARYRPAVSANFNTPEGGATMCRVMSPPKGTNSITCAVKSTSWFVTII
jgi:hypothetical protein